MTGSSSAPWSRWCLFTRLYEPVDYVGNSHCGQQVSLFGRDPDVLARLIDTRAVRARLESLFGAGISVEVALDSRLGEEPSGKTDARVRLAFLLPDVLTRLTHACDHGSAIMLMGWSAAPA